MVPIPTIDAEQQADARPAEGGTVRWKRRLPWLLLALSLILSLGLGITVLRLRTAHQASRSAAASAVSFQLRRFAGELANAQAALQRGDTAAASAFFMAADRESAAVSHSFSTYEVILLGDRSDRSVSLAMTFRIYGHIANDLATQIQDHRALSADEYAMARALHLDIALMNATFSEDLLSTGSSEALGDALTHVCTLMLTETIKQQQAIVGIDDESRNACRSTP
jgi:hypothetical protein